MSSLPDGSRLGRWVARARRGWGDGLSEADPRELTVARAIAALAAVWLLVTGTWEITGPLGPGIDAISSQTALGAENMLRWRVLEPITQPTLLPPTAADCTFYRPFGIFWTSAPLLGLFGHHAWVCRLPAVLETALSPLLLYGLGRALWSPLSGAVAALAYSLIPVAVANQTLTSVGLAASFGALLTSFALVRFTQSRARRWTVLFLLGLVYSVNADWSGYAFSAALLGIFFFHTFVGRRRLSEAEFRGAATLHAWASLSVVLVGALTLLALSRLGLLDELVLDLQGPDLKSSEGAAPPPLASWLWVAFTPVGFSALLLGAPVLVGRALFRRRVLELLPLGLGAMALAQLPFLRDQMDRARLLAPALAAASALGLSGISQTLSELAARGTALFLPGRLAVSRNVARAALALGLLLSLSMARDAAAALERTRKTGGRDGDPSLPLLADRDKVAALTYLSGRLRSGEAVVVDPSVRSEPWMGWILGTPTRTAGVIGMREGERFFIADLRFLRPGAARELVHHLGTTAVGPFLIADRRAPQGPLRALQIERREPRAWERFWVSSSHALREIRKDPFSTWELRDSLGQQPNPPVTEPPRTFEELRIGHNQALARGDRGLAARLKARLLRGVDTSSGTTYQDGTRLLGVRLTSGASEILTVYFEARGPVEQRFSIQSLLEEGPRLSFSSSDPIAIEVGAPPWIAPSAWKAGFLYQSSTELMRRAGTERLIGSFNRTGPDPPLSTREGARSVTLLVLP